MKTSVLEYVSELGSGHDKCANLWYPKNSDFLDRFKRQNALQNVESQQYLLFEVSPVLLVNEDKVKVITGSEFLVDVAEGWRQVKATKEYTNGDGLA